MRTRFLLAGLTAALAFGPVAAHADHPVSGNPSQHCGGSPTPTDPKAKVDTKRPGVCFNLQGGFKGAIIFDVKTSSLYFDGDSTNHSGFNRCADGYVGVRAGGSEPTLLWSQGGNYDQDARPGDGGTNGSGPGHSNDAFTPEERGEVLNCLGDF